MKPTSDWKQALEERLPLLGHRNWLVVADAAYPSQSKAGIETIVSGVGQQETMEFVLTQLNANRHIRPIIYFDRELKYMEEEDAPGVDDYRLWLHTTLGGMSLNSAPHERIIARLDQAAQMFSILVIKSTMTIPYTSVFFELDCGYWNAEAEARLRATILSEEGK